MTYTFVIAGRHRRTNNKKNLTPVKYVSHFGFGLHRIFGLVYKRIRLGGGGGSTAQTVKVTVFRDVTPCSLVYPRLLKRGAMYSGIALSSGM